MVNKSLEQDGILSILMGAIENTNEAFVTIDQDHTVVVFNRAAERMFGYPREEVLGTDLRLLLGPGCREGHQQAVERFKKTREPRLIGHENEFEAMRKDGKTFPASLSFSVAEVAGRLFFTAIIRDMTKTRELEEQVTRAERLASLGQVVAEISHEIKNPLVLIGGLARQLRDKAADPKTAGKLEVIVGEVLRLEGLLAELRDLYVVRKLARDEVELNSLLIDVQVLLKSECQRRGISCDLRLAAEAPWILGDRGKLHQVLLNLAKNSIEALTKGGTLTISCQAAPPDLVQIVLADNGPGIPDVYREKIFLPFFTTKRKGTGLGLALSRRIIADHPGASLHLQSEEGRGTAVTLTFPRLR